ncbi:hypothetical protein P4O66_011372, partial [Electrophorus voltai]
MFLGGPEYGPGSDSVESCRDQPDYENRHMEEDSAGSYDPYMDYYEGYTDYGERGEYSDISLWSDLGSDYVEDPPMEVEEVLYGDSLANSHVRSVVSGNDEPPASMIPPKALPRRYRLGTSKPARVKLLEVTSSKKETPFTRAHCPGTHAPKPKPRKGRKEAAPVPTPEMGKVAGALPELVSGRSVLAPRHLVLVLGLQPNRLAHWELGRGSVM